MHSVDTNQLGVILKLLFLMFMSGILFQSQMLKRVWRCISAFCYCHQRIPSLLCTAFKMSVLCFVIYLEYLEQCYPVELSLIMEMFCNIVSLEHMWWAQLRN